MINWIEIVKKSQDVKTGDMMMVGGQLVTVKEVMVLPHGKISYNLTIRHEDRSESWMTMILDINMDITTLH